MKDLYLDCFSGISGNMLIGALLDAGMPQDQLVNELRKLNLDDKEYAITIKQVNKQGITACYFNVTTNEHSPHRNLHDITMIISQSSLADELKETAVNIFTNLAQAEAHVHGVSIDKIHFHEVGAIDTIIDIVGTVICLNYLQVKNIYVSNLHTGTGFFDCTHGKMPIPAPATAYLLKRFPFKSGEINKELITPTGAAILNTLACENTSQQIPSFEKIAYGAGSWELEQPNVLRMYVKDVLAAAPVKEDLLILEANIDDMNPQIFDYLSEKLFIAGALDVWIAPIMMKKNRPAQMLSVLTNNDKHAQCCSIIFTETTTLGIRLAPAKRIALARKIKLVSTVYGQVHCKISMHNNAINNISAEYDDCHRIALEKNIPLKTVQREALRLAYYLAENGL